MTSHAWYICQSKQTHAQYMSQTIWVLRNVSYRGICTWKVKLGLRSRVAPLGRGATDGHAPLWTAYLFLHGRNFGVLLRVLSGVLHHLLELLPAKHIEATQLKQS